MRHFKFSTVVMIIALLTSCLTQQEKEAKRYGERPNWVDKTPLSNSYYYGIGSIQKSNPDYKNAAIKAALDQLINEISVTVNSSSTLTTLETNEEFKQEYAQRTQLTAVEKIEGYELVESWENDTHYYVFYRLSKTKHQQLKTERTQKAIERAVSNHKSGRERYADRDYRNAFITWVQGLEILIPFLEEDLTTEFDGKSGNIALELLREIRQMDKNFSLTPSFTEKELKAGSYLSNDDVYVTVKDLSGARATNVPITFEYRSIGAVKEKTITDQNGIARFNIGKIKALKRSQEIIVLLDFAQLLGATSKNRVLTQLINLPPGKSLVMNLKVEAPAVFIVGKESMDGKAINAAINLETQLRNALLRNNFRFTDDKKSADLELRYEIHTQSIDQNSQLTLISSSGNVSILAKDQLVYSEAIPAQKGSHFSDKAAVDQAYEKIAPIIADRIIPKFSGKYFGY